jgi:hypothetical protein
MRAYPGAMRRPRHLARRNHLQFCAQHKGANISFRNQNNAEWLENSGTLAANEKQP